jgi:hypothetical protein
MTGRTRRSTKPHYGACTSGRIELQGGRHSKTSKTRSQEIVSALASSPGGASEELLYEPPKYYLDVVLLRSTVTAY